MGEQDIIDGLKLICQCRGVKKRVFLRHIADGIDTVEGLQRVTGAASGDCRGKRCLPRIRDMVETLDR